MQHVTARTPFVGAGERSSPGSYFGKHSSAQALVVCAITELPGLRPAGRGEGTRPYVSSLTCFPKGL